MSFRFTKMHGLGNDFMVIDGIHQKIELTPDLIVALSKRDTGVGFDQCLLIEKSLVPDVDFFYRIFNADGVEIGQCGNGARCIARFISHYGLTQKRVITVTTHTTQMHLQLNEDDSVTVNMGSPQFKPQDIPLLSAKIQDFYPIIMDNTTLQVHALSMGNPHAVINVSHVSEVPVQQIGQFVSEHALFPEQTNVEFMQITSPKDIHLRVYERGCGETRACGSGAAAAVAVGRLFYGLDAHVEVHLPGGSLKVSWEGEQNHDLFLTGPATFVYEGRLM